MSNAKIKLLSVRPNFSKPLLHDVSFHIRSDMSCEEMASEVMSAKDALSRSHDAAAMEVMDQGLAMLEMSYPDAPRVQALAVMQRAARETWGNES